MFLTIKLCTHAKLFEIELVICIKIGLALNNLQRLICHKTQRTNQSTEMTGEKVKTPNIFLNIKRVNR